MNEILGVFSHFWWLVLILAAAIFYKFTLRVFFGMVIIPKNKVGLVTKKFVLFGKNKTLPEGKIFAINGEAGYQAQILPPGGPYWGKWVWQYEIVQEPLTVIAPGSIGLIIAKDGAAIPNGRILAQKVDCDNFQNAVAFLKNGGQKGRQAAYITAGSHPINRSLFEVKEVPIKLIKDGMVGLVTTLDGIPLPQGQIAGKEVSGHNKFQDADAFIAANGFRGRQEEIILAGTYNINPWFVSIEEVQMTQIEIGHVGVVISYAGEEGQDLTGAQFKHGNLVEKGKKGVWLAPLDPGMYAINTYTTKVESVPTTNIVLNWASGRTESHNLDKNLSTITVRSSDGYTFNLDVSQIIHIPAPEAPKVIARFGSMANLVSQVLEPTIGNYFRNSAQKNDVISFLSSRSERQEEAKTYITQALTQYNVLAVDTLIGDINPPEPLMKTLTDRKLAGEQKKTYEVQMGAEITRKDLENAKASADMQKDVVTAERKVEIAQRDAESAVKKGEGEGNALKAKASGESESIKMIADANGHKLKVEGQGEGERILFIGKSTAESYKLAVDAMGQDNFANLQITKEIASNHLTLVPQIMGGGNGGSFNPAEMLMTLILKDKVEAGNVVKKEAEVKEEKKD